MKLSKEMQLLLYRKILEYLNKSKINYDNLIETIPPDKLNEIYNYLNSIIKDGKTVLNILEKFPQIFLIDDYKNKISLLYNSFELYGILICNKDDIDYYFLNNSDIKDLAIYRENINKPVLYNSKNIIVKKGYYKEKDRSFLLENFLGFDKLDYMKQILDIKETDTMEDKIRKLKKININEKGYHIK